MDTIKILLGATVALLFAAVVLSWSNMKHGVAGASPDELTRVRQQLAELDKESQHLATERELQNLRASNQAATEATTAAKPARSDKMAELEARLAETEAKLAETETDKGKAQRDAKVAEKEAGLIAQHEIESHDKQLRRARQIKDALLIAKVKQYVENQEVGSFAVIEIERPENVQPGSVLGVRRNTGILGQVKVGEVTGSEAVANPVISSFQGAPVDLKAGDELIIPPPF